MIQVREANPTDAKIIAQLHARSWRENYRGMLSDEYLDGDVFSERLAFWEQRLASSDGKQLAVIALDEDRPLGFAFVIGGADSKWGPCSTTCTSCLQIKGAASAGSYFTARVPGCAINATAKESTCGSSMPTHAPGRSTNDSAQPSWNAPLSRRQAGAAWPNGGTRGRLSTLSAVSLPAESVRPTLIRPPVVNRHTTPYASSSYLFSAAFVSSSRGALTSFRRSGAGSRNLHQTLIEAQWPWSYRIRRSGRAA